MYEWGERRWVDMFDVAFSLLEHSYFFGIYVKACDVKPGPAEFDNERQADITKTNNRDLRCLVCYFINE